MQLYSMPHWQVWTLARLPDQKYCGFPFRSFHHE
jgi:hypothetical protein